MRVFSLALLALAACASTKFTPDNLSCDAQQRCLDGFVCHPETQLCVQATPLGCPDGVCPSLLRTGVACTTIGSFVPCANDGVDCSNGCRTCGADKTWSQCSAPAAPFRACVEETCNGLDDDCNGKVDDLSEIAVASQCQQATSGAAVDVWACLDGACVVDKCRTGFANADGNANNGCENVCAPSNGGVETCDGQDNDCDGVSDEVDAVGCVPRFLDRDDDGLGTGASECRCAGAATRPYSATVNGDCDDDNATCGADCSDDDNDGVCASADCSDGLAQCTTDCTVQACRVGP